MNRDKINNLGNLFLVSLRSRAEGIPANQRLTTLIVAGAAALAAAATETPVQISLLQRVPMKYGRW